MNDIQKRARELLAGELDEPHLVARVLEATADAGVFITPKQALRAIEHALSSPPNVGEGELVRDSFDPEGDHDGGELLVYASTPPPDRAKEARQCSVCTAIVAEYPEGMCCHCQELPWPLASLKDPSHAG